MAVASTAKLINYPSYNPIKNPFKTSSSKGKEHGIAESREIFNWLLELVRDINWIPLLPSSFLVSIDPPSFFDSWIISRLRKKGGGKKTRRNQFSYQPRSFDSLSIVPPSFFDSWIISRLRKENAHKSVFLSIAFFRFVDAKKYIIKKKVCMITRLGKERNIVRFNFCPHLNCLKFQVRTDDDFHGNYTRKL